jgi:GNAT superfamily N-acetyltransferase
VAAAKARKYVLPDQLVPRVELPSEEPVVVVLESGARVSIRAIRISDEDALQDLFYRLSEESAYQRFLGHTRPPSHEELLRLVDTTFDDCSALVATVHGEAGEELVGMIRYDVTPATRFAEVSVVVADAWQRRGVGTALFRRLSALARERGVAGFTAQVLLSNTPMLGIFNESGLPVESVLEEGVYRIRMVFD